MTGVVMETSVYCANDIDRVQDDLLQQRLQSGNTTARECLRHNSMDTQWSDCHYQLDHSGHPGTLETFSALSTSLRQCLQHQKLPTGHYVTRCTGQKKVPTKKQFLPMDSVFNGLIMQFHLPAVFVFLGMFGILISGVHCQHMRFVVEPNNRSVAEGGTVVLNCTVANREGPVSWTKGDFGLGYERHLPGFDRYSLIGSEERGEFNLQIQDVTVDDEDRFECQVGPSNRYPRGLRSQKAYLFVIVPSERPVIINSPEIPVVFNKVTNITCRANRGKPAATLTWLIEGQRMTEGVSSESVPNGKYFDSVSVLSYSATLADSSRRIECLASTANMGPPIRTSATLVVHFAPILDNMTVNVSSLSVMREHDYLRFSCTGSAYPINVTWRWYLGDESIPEANSSVYYIHAITPEYNRKKLSCEATNIIGSTRADKVLNIQYGPRITDITDIVGADIGGHAELRCEVDGNPEPNVIWRRKDRNNSPRTLSTKNLYRIDIVNSDSFGLYVCTASVDGFPDVRKDAFLLKNEKPEMKSEKQQMATEGERGKLECLTRAIPKPVSITWSKDGKDINYAMSGRFSKEDKDLGLHMRSVLHIQVVQSEDFGYYNCTVENDKGVATEQIELVEKHVLPITYIIIGIIGGLAFIFVTTLICVLYRRCKRDDQGSALGSYTDTDSSSDKKREKADSPTTLMGQLRQEYRFSADYDDMPYKTANEEGKRDNHTLLAWATCKKRRQEHPTKGNNNGYGFIEPCETYSDNQIYDGEYVRRSDDLIPDRLDPLYTSGTGYSMSSFRGNCFDTTPPLTMTRLTPLHMSNAKLATDV